MNVILLSGFIGKDAEVTVYDWGEVMKFSIATTESYKNKDGERVDETTWHNIEKIGKNLENFANHLKKGVAVEVSGQQQHRKVDEKYFSSVKANNIGFAPSRKADNSEQNSNSAPMPDENDIPF